MSDIATRLNGIVEELGGFYLEREQVLRSLVMALLTRQHVFLLGPVGSGKSAILEDLIARIDGAEFFAVQLHEQMGREEVFGPIDVPSFSANGVWERDVEGYLPTAHLAMIDEIDKGGPAVRQLLRVINERRFRNGKGHELHLPLMTAVASANELLPASEVAVWDRFLLREEVSYLAEPENFITLLTSVMPDSSTRTSQTVVSLAQLEWAQREVEDVALSDSTAEAMLQVRSDLGAKGVIASDRRWRAAVGIVKAAAWLDGRTETTTGDLTVLESILWGTLEQRSTVSEAVLKVGSKAQKDLARALLAIDSVADTLRARAGQSAEDLGGYFGDGSHFLKQAEEVLDRVSGKVPTYRLAQARRTWRETKINLLMQCAGFDRAVAEDTVDT